MSLLPLDSKARKEIPLWTFLSQYFPKTFIAMASLSFKANEKHNPGQPMHWSRNKSGDHKDCIARHLLDEERIDPETGECEAVAAAWRACANAEIVIERIAAKAAIAAREEFVCCHGGPIWPDCKTKCPKFQPEESK